MTDQSAVTTFLFTDIEGSSRLWEEEPARMPTALARHDRILREAVQRNHGVVVKTTGDGVHAAFQDPRNALVATVELLQVLADPASTEGLPLHLRCGMHAGVLERRDDDYFGSVVNRAARIMSAAHGGQVLISQAVADLVRDRLPGGVSLRDLGAVRLRDLSSPERVYQVEHAGLRSDFPALRSLEAVPNNLPQQVTTFVGREREQDEVKMALRKARLVTLSGIGGMGKTRLSLQVAADVVSDFRDGVWLIELASIADERHVPQAVASVLGVKEEAGRPVSEALLKHVRDRRLLLVLDNCEHLVRGCAELASQLLQAGAQTKILASSREHFNIAGEAIYTVPPLSVPKPGDGITVASIMRCEAVRLFVERAMAVQPAFRLTEQNAPAVVEICQRLDGIPLALELAAARVRALAVEQIAARVNDRFRLLTIGDRTAMPRQQTLRAMIEWSHDLLTDKERVLFRRLAVFAGGWTLEAAEAVCAGGDVGEGDVLDLIADLVDKSLVMMEAQGGRYGFLETVRQYAGERLEASGERDDVRTRHLQYYVSVAEQARARLPGADLGAWLPQQHFERENFLAAHGWCDRAADGARLGLKLSIATKFYWLYSGAAGLGYRMTLEAVRRPGVPEHSPDTMQALYMLGQFCASIGRYGEAIPYLEKALAIARDRGDKRRAASVLHVAGMAAMGLGQSAVAREHLREALELATGLGNRRELAAYLIELAQLERLEGNPAAAEPLYERALALGREMRDREVSATALLDLAMIVIGRGALDRAKPMLAEAADVAIDTASEPIRQSVLDVCAALAARRGQSDRAMRFIGASEALLQASGMQRHPADVPFVAEVVAQWRASMCDAHPAPGPTSDSVATVMEAREWLRAPG